MSAMTRPPWPPTGVGSPTAVGLARRRRVDEPGARRPRRGRRRRRREAVDDTDALVTTTPRLALAVVTADCVPVLMADARAGVIAAVARGPGRRATGHRGARACEAMVDAGARVEDISVLLGPAVSGRQLRGARGDGRRGGARRCRAAAPPPARHPGSGPAGRDRRATRALGVAAIDVDPRCTVDDRDLFSHRRDAPTGRLASLVWMEAGVTTARELELSDALAAAARAAGPRRRGRRARRRRHRTAAGHEVLSGQRCRGAAPIWDVRRSANPATRKRRRRSTEIRGLPGCDSPSAGTWSAGSSATRRESVAEWAYAAHSVDNAKVIAALDRAAADALADGRRAEPLRVYLQISLDGDEATGRGGRRGRRPHRRAVRRHRRRARAACSSA